MEPRVSEDETLTRNWIFNNFEYYGGVVVAVYGVEHKTEN